MNHPRQGIGFHEHTALARGLKLGMAVHLYTGQRVTTDIDAEFGARVAMPRDLSVEVVLEDGSEQVLYFDTNYNPMFALMHEDYQGDAIEFDLGLSHIRLLVLSPLDLAVSKVARFADNDREDITALVRAGLVSSEELERRGTQALSGFVDGRSMVRLNLDDALGRAREIERNRLDT